MKLSSGRYIISVPCTFSNSAYTIPANMQFTLPQHHSLPLTRQPHGLVLLA
jgi:hypothetical protein